MFSSILSTKSLIQSSFLCSLLFIPSIVLVISDISFFISDWSYSMFSKSFFMLTILVIITLNSLSDKFLASISCSLLLENCLVLAFDVFLCLHILAAFLYFLPY